MTRRSRSLERRLTATVIVVAGVAFAALSATVYGIYSRGSRERFDERLTEAGRAAALLVGRDGVRPSELETDLLPTLDQSRGATSFAIWNEAGSVVARYPPQGSFAFRAPQQGAPRFETVPLPDGRRARLYSAWLELPAKGTAGSERHRIGVAVLRETELLERRLTRLSRIMWASAVATAIACGLAVFVVIRRSMRGVALLSSRIGGIDAFSPGESLEVGDLPDELRPPFAKVNDLLARIEQVLRRERQFSADVSHELRTPLAGLRTILEVSGSRQRSASEYRTTLREALEVVRQLEAIVENLLALARLGAGQLAEQHPEEIAVTDLVNACFQPLAELADRRGVRFDSWVPPTASIVADRVKLRLITSNLLSNAVQYTAEGGWITVESEPGQGVVLRVRDSGPPIAEGALPDIFNPFFRVERSRSGEDAHFGIGLTLVRGLCETCGYRVAAENEPGGSVAFTITRLPTSTARAEATPVAGAEDRLG